MQAKFACAKQRKIIRYYCENQNKVVPKIPGIKTRQAFQVSASDRTQSKD